MAAVTFVPSLTLAPRSRGWSSMGGRSVALAVGCLLFLTGSGCAGVSRAAPAMCHLVVENQTDYVWEIEAVPVGVQNGLRAWRVAPNTAITVELTPGPWTLRQTLLAQGTSRSTPFDGEAGVTYRWPLATLYSRDAAP